MNLSDQAQQMDDVGSEDDKKKARMTALSDMIGPQSSPLGGQGATSPEEDDPNLNGGDNTYNTPTTKNLDLSQSDSPFLPGSPPEPPGAPAYMTTPDATNAEMAQALNPQDADFKNNPLGSAMGWVLGKTLNDNKDPSEDKGDSIRDASSPLDYAPVAEMGGAAMQGGKATARAIAADAPALLGNQVGSAGMSLADSMPAIKNAISKGAQSVANNTGPMLSKAAGYMLKPNAEDVADAATQYGSGLIGKLKTALGSADENNLAQRAQDALASGNKSITPDMVTAARQREQTAQRINDRKAAQGLGKYMTNSKGGAND